MDDSGAIVGLRDRIAVMEVDAAENKEARDGLLKTLLACASMRSKLVDHLMRIGTHEVDGADEEQPAFIWARDQARLALIELHEDAGSLKTFKDWKEAEDDGDRTAE